MAMAIRVNTETIANEIMHIANFDRDRINPFPNYLPNVLRISDIKYEKPLISLFRQAQTLKDENDIDNFVHKFSDWKKENRIIRKRNEICKNNEEQISLIKRVILSLSKETPIKVSDIVDGLCSNTCNIFINGNGEECRPIYKVECAIQDLVSENKIERQMMRTTNGFYKQGIVVK